MMRLDWKNISLLEIWWAIPPAFALIITLALGIWAWRSFSTIRAKVKAEPLRYRAWGPRWNFACWLLAALSAFAVAWAIGIVLAVVAMMTPPPLQEANREAATWFAWLFIFRDAMFALAEAGIWVALRFLASEPILPQYLRWKTVRR